MSTVSANNLDRHAIMSLLSNLGSGEDDQPAPECTPFDWRQCRYFTDSQMEIIQGQLKLLMHKISQDLTSLCSTELEATLSTVSQHSAGPLIDEFNQSEAGYLYQAFGADSEQRVGMLALVPEHARSWVGLMLGGSEESEEETPAKLNSFELSLLMDLTTVVIQAWDAMGDSFVYRPHVDGVGENLSVGWDRMTYVLCVTWTLSQPDQEDGGGASEARFIIPCHVFSELVGKVDCRQSLTEEAVTQAMTEVIQDYDVNVHVELGQTTLSFQAMMQLRKDDVVVLDRCVNESVDVLVDGRKVFTARPGQTKGHQAVYITGVE